METGGSSPRSLAGIPRLQLLAEGYELLERGEAQAARSYFAAAVERERTPEALEALGLAAWLLFDEPTVFQAREGAYELYRQRGDRLGAARIATWLTVDSATLRGQLAVANGWLGRARSLLADLPESPEHAWFEIVEAEKAMMADNDGESARLHAAAAVAIARRTAAGSLEAYAMAVEGLALVTTGRVHDGMSKLDEAATASLGGDVQEQFIVSSVLCYMMDACDRVRDWDRAREWFGHVSRLAASWNGREFYAQCRPHYAVVLTWRGAWQDAEDQLLLSVDDLQRVSPPMAVEGMVRLAELRWRQGRWHEAAALFEQVKQEPLAQLGQAELALSRGDPALALEFAERCLRRLPTNDRLERMPALELFIRACLASGDVERARQALPELEEIAASVPTRPVRAAGLLARGLVAAAANPEAARCDLDDAVDLFEACGAPFETSRARLELAPLLLRLGKRAEAAEQARLAMESLEKLGASFEAERAHKLLTEATGAAALSGREAPCGLTPRELEVLRLLAAGMSNQEIAERLVLSIRTVQRHVENIYTKTGARGRAAAGVFAVSNGLLQSPMGI